YTARLSRQHNDANVLAVGARIIAPTLAREILEVWLATPFEGGRHERRLEQIGMIERGEL
ncbi:MAG: RpiB/LacA/LacB family sugar-phosphate isomerase, partial [Actinomycetota bacterium]